MFPIEIIDNKKVMKIPRGIHYIKETLQITDDNLLIQGEDGAILRCSIPLRDTTWHLFKNGIYYTNVEQIPDALYMNDTKYRMARYPKYDPEIDLQQKSW